MIRASDLIGCQVQTESGKRLGKVHDLRVQANRDGWTLAGLILGRGGLIARLIGGDGPAVYEGDVIAWETIVRFEDGRITVREHQS
jgi:sporulation protein YlmC with PRC-barrel domain